MYKLVHNLVPSNLCSMIPDIDPLRYETRQRFDLPHFRARTDLYDKSFFPSATRLWNELPLTLRHSLSLQEFKSKLLPAIERPVSSPELLNYGKRFLSILHTRLRLGASQLNSHLLKIGVKDTARCSCGSEIEDTWHYFLLVPFMWYPDPNYILKYLPSPLSHCKLYCMAVQNALFMRICRYLQRCMSIYQHLNASNP